MCMTIFVQISSRIPDSETRYDYNAEDLLVSAYNENGRASIVYNERNLPSEVQYSSGYTLYYGYNARGQRTYLADNHGYNVSYIYDLQSRLFEVRKSNDSSLITRFEYEDGFLARKILGNEAYTIFTYNMNGKLVQQDNYFSNQTLSSSNRYEYDLKGKVTRITDGSNQRWSYRYDNAGQLLGWTSSSGEEVSYTYDSNGNRIFLQRGATNERYVVNNMNQYTSYKDEQYSYDANGNLVQKVTPRGTERYHFDAEGKMVSTETPHER